MSETKEEDNIRSQHCGGECPCRRCSDPAQPCSGCGRCCGKTVEYVVIDTFVWPPWPESPNED